MDAGVNEVLGLQQQCLHIRSELEKSQAVRQQQELTIARQSCRIADAEQLLRAAKEAEDGASKQLAALATRFATESNGYANTIEHLTTRLNQAQKDRDVLAIRSRESTVRESDGLDRLTALENDLDQAKQETVALAATYEDARTALHQADQSLAAMSKHASQLTDSLQAERAKSVAAESMATALRQQHALTEEDRRALMEARSSAMAAISQLNDTESTLRLERESTARLQARHDQAVQRGRIIETERASLSDQVDRKTREVSAMSASLEAQQAEIEQMQQQLESRLAQFTDAQCESQVGLEALVGTARDFAALLQIDMTQHGAIDEPSNATDNPLSHPQRLAALFSAAFMVTRSTQAECWARVDESSMAAAAADAEVATITRQLGEAHAEAENCRNEASQLRSKLSVAVRKLEGSAGLLRDSKSENLTLQKQADAEARRVEVDAAGCRKKQQQQQQRLLAQRDLLDRICSALEALCRRISTTALYDSSLYGGASAPRTDRRARIEDGLQFLSANVEAVERSRQLAERRSNELAAHINDLNDRHQTAVDQLIAGRHASEQELDAERRAIQSRLAQVGDVSTQQTAALSERLVIAEAELASTTEHATAHAAVVGRLNLELSQSHRIRDRLVALLRRCARGLHRARAVNSVRSRMLRDADSKAEAAATVEAAARKAIAGLPSRYHDSPNRPGNDSPDRTDNGPLNHPGNDSPNRRRRFRVAVTAVLAAVRLRATAVAETPAPPPPKDPAAGAAGAATATAAGSEVPAELLTRPDILADRSLRSLQAVFGFTPARDASFGSAYDSPWGRGLAGSGTGYPTVLVLERRRAATTLLVKQLQAAVGHGHGNGHGGDSGDGDGACCRAESEKLRTALDMRAEVQAALDSATAAHTAAIAEREVQLADLRARLADRPAQEMVDRLEADVFGLQRAAGRGAELETVVQQQSAEIEKLVLQLSVTNSAVGVLKRQLGSEQHARAGVEEQLDAAKAELGRMETSIGHLGDSYLSEVSLLSDSYLSQPAHHGTNASHPDGRPSPHSHDAAPCAFGTASTVVSACAGSPASGGLTVPSGARASLPAGGGSGDRSGSVSSADLGSVGMSALDTSAMAVASAMLESIDGDGDF